MLRQTRATTVFSQADGFHPIGVRAADAQPRLRHCVLGLALRAAHAVCNCPQPGPIILEGVNQPLGFVHAVTFLSNGVSKR
jgi:hypothetical protein